MSQPIHVIARLSAEPEKADMLRAALIDLVTSVRTEPGCIRYDLHESVDAAGEFAFCEIWADEAALDAHNETAAMKAFVDQAGAWISNLIIERYRPVC